MNISEAFEILEDDKEEFKNLSSELKKNKEILMYCNPDFWNWDYDAMDDYKSIVKKYHSKDLEFIKSGIEKYGCDSSFLIMADESLFENESLMLLAIKKDVSIGNPILWGSNSLKNNVLFLKKAISINPDILELIQEDNNINEEIKSQL